MLLIERQALRFTQREFAKWLLVKREIQDMHFDYTEVIHEYFNDSGVPFVEIKSDSDDMVLTAFLKSGVQSCIFRCYWYMPFVNNSGYKNIGRDLVDILTLIDQLDLYPENELVN